MSPAPSIMLQHLQQMRAITAEEARLASLIPLAEDITVESDSGGHTDNRPLGPLFPAVMAVRDECMKQYKYDQPIRLGVSGGIGAAAAAFAYGASYIMTGTINQSSVEAGSKPVQWKGKTLFDGGVADPLPLQKAMNDGYSRHVVVLNKERGYRKARSKWDWPAPIIYRRYPHYVKAIMERYVKYNQIMDEIERMEQTGDIFIFQPSRAMVLVAWSGVRIGSSRFMS